MIQAFNWTTGEPEWQARLDTAVIGSPALALYRETPLLAVPTANGAIEALALATGESLWTMPATLLNGNVSGGLAIGDGGVLYAATDSGWLHAIQPDTATDSGWLHAIHPDTGAAIWSLDLSESVRFVQAPAIAGAAVFVSSADSVIAIDRDSPELAWQAVIDSEPTTPPSVIETKGLVFVGAADGQVHALSTLTGKQRWSAQTTSRVVGLAVQYQLLIATCENGNVYAWELESGAIRWLINLGGNVAGPPLVGGETVLVGTLTGSLHAIDAATGLPALSLPPRVLGAEIAVPLATAPPWLFVATSDALYAFAP
jgi:outer membrane protein assembly factor BamB